MYPSPSDQEAVADAINSAVRNLGVRFRDTKNGALLFEPVDEVEDERLDALLDSIEDALNQMDNQQVHRVLTTWKINALGITRRTEALLAS